MRDYSSISPSAKSLLLLKGLTDIPFIADAVKILAGEGVLRELDKNAAHEGFLKRLFHFEIRYKTIDNLLDNIGSKNILEMSSGFSFRGLNITVQNADVTYIDTDLPEVIATKDSITERLVNDQSLHINGELLSIPLNVLDEEEFLKTIALFPPGPITIVNEGLLVYLNKEEKTKLLKIIHKILVTRGGHWITGDIYIKKELPTDTADDQFSAFLKAHHVEENKFDSFEQAEAFFKERGFIIHKKAERVMSQLSALKYVGLADIGLIAQAAKIGKIRETWALTAVNPPKPSPKERA